VSETQNLNPAEEAAERAWASLRSYLEDRSSFVFEAGAGAGKTYSLIAALKFILDRDARELSRRHQQVACITFTNVARDTILAQTDSHPAIFCDTTHAFAWMLISGFQKRLCELVPTLPGWQGRLEQLSEVSLRSVEYALGRRDIEGDKVLLHHDDIFPLFIELMSSQKFRNVLTSRFPIILIDEYQDTNADLVKSLKNHFIGQPEAPQFGFFGDHWQKIYGEGCGSIEHTSLKRVDKRANFRSVKVIVDCLNRIRPELTQAVRDPAASGTVQVYHTNGWMGTRRNQNHWQGDLPAEASAKAFVYVKRDLERIGWDFSGPTKVLMLTHRALATEMGYSSLPTIFRFNDSFTRKTNDVIAFFEEHLEPAAEAFSARQYGVMFDAIDARRPVMNGPAEKAVWANAMRRLCKLRETGTVGDVICHLQNCRLPVLSDKVVHLEQELADAKVSGEPLPPRLEELDRLHGVSYQEIIALCRYLKGHSPFETKHGVKGEEFENVLVVFGRGWNEYDFNAYLEMAGHSHLTPQQQINYERYRNLFYVAVSRPKTRLALLFTQKLSSLALSTLAHFFESNSITDIGRAI
jgi:DNA helicase II / ATP-dependent DNA helicase PcrA